MLFSWSYFLEGDFVFSFIVLGSVGVFFCKCRFVVWCIVADDLFLTVGRESIWLDVGRYGLVELGVL